jgi:hypothetical protein
MLNNGWIKRDLQRFQTSGESRMASATLGRRFLGWPATSANLRR